MPKRSIALRDNGDFEINPAKIMRYVRAIRKGVRVGSRAYKNIKYLYDTYVRYLNQYTPYRDARISIMEPIYNYFRGGNSTDSQSRPLLLRSSSNSTNMSSYEQGKMMLEWKNSLTRKFTTHCYFTMSPYIVRRNLGLTPTDLAVYNTANGVGPLLFWTYNLTPNQTLSSTNLPSPTYMMLNDSDVGFDYDLPTVNKGLGINGIVYVFIADWPFAVFNIDPVTQSSTLDEFKKGRALSWKYKDYDVTTDPNLPRTLSDIVYNKDWSYFTHYYTELSFDFTNVDMFDYVVEILFFKFKADADTMNYQRQVLAPLRRQTGAMQAYCENEIGMDNMADITVVHRKRKLIRGCSLDVVRTGMQVNGTTTQLNLYAPESRKNEYTYKYIVNRKYVMKRPILNNYNADLTEAEFFGAYCDKQKSVYCRVQAWPASPPILADHYVGCNPANGNYKNFFSNAEINVTAATGATFLTQFNGLACTMQKRSHWKLDEPILKGSA